MADFGVSNWPRERFGRRLYSCPLWHQGLKCPLLAHGMMRFLQDLLDLCSPHWSSLPPQVTVHLCLVLSLTLFSISVLNRDSSLFMSRPCVVTSALSGPDLDQQLLLRDSNMNISEWILYHIEPWENVCQAQTSQDFKYICSYLKMMNISSPKTCRAILGTY